MYIEPYKFDQIYGIISWLPDEFHDPSESPLTTMSATRKTTNLGSGQTFDASVIYSRPLEIMNSCDFNLEDLFSHELSPIPSALFQDGGNMRPLTSKPKPKNWLACEWSLLEGCALLWSVHWPASRTMGDLFHIMVGYLHERLDYTDAYPVFYQYHPYSRKGSTRIQRSSVRAKQEHHFKTQSYLPSQSVWLTFTEHKVQIIDILGQNLIHHFQENRCQTRLEITSSDNIPDEVHDGVHIKGVIWPSVMKKLMLSSLTKSYR